MIEITVGDKFVVDTDTVTLVGRRPLTLSRGGTIEVISVDHNSKTMGLDCVLHEKVRYDQLMDLVGARMLKKVEEASEESDLPAVDQRVQFKVVLTDRNLEVSGTIIGYSGLGLPVAEIDEEFRTAGGPLIPGRWMELEPVDK